MKVEGGKDRNVWKIHMLGKMQFLLLLLKGKKKRKRRERFWRERRESERGVKGGEIRYIYLLYLYSGPFQNEAEKRNDQL